MEDSSWRLWAVIWSLLHSHLVTDAKCQLRPSSSLCGPLQWFLYVCKLGLCHSMVAGFQDQVSWERKPGESSTVFYNLDFRVTSVAFCWIEVSHWGQSISQEREQNPSPQWRSVSSILEEGHVGGHLLVWPSLENIICYNIH